MSSAPQLYVSDHLEDLWGRLDKHLARGLSRAAATGGGVPVPPWVVVPTSVVGEWLQVRAARGAGVSLGVRYLSLAEFYGLPGMMGRAERALADAHRAWAPEALRWRILSEVAGVAGQLGFAEPGAVGPRDRFAAAELLAAELDRTLRCRPAWARLWRADRPALQPEAPAETWQRKLWLKLAQGAGMPPHPAELTGIATEAAASVGRVCDRPGVFFVVAGEVEPLALQTLRWLAARGWAVEVHVLLPSVGYLGDLPARRARRKREEAASEEMYAETGHPLLVSLGQQAAGVFWQLGELDNDYSAWPEAGSAVGEAAPRGGVLACLQAAVRGERENKTDASPADRSLWLHECHGPRRELEVLRDELLRAFRDLPGLMPEEVKVAAVNFDAYAPLAEAVLRRPAPGLPGGIPVRLTAVAAREANPVLVALLGWLRMAVGRQSASELLELFSLEAVKRRLGVAENEEAHARLLEWVRRSGLTHGLGANDGSTPGTWPAARDRLAGGFWFGPLAEGVVLPSGGADAAGTEPVWLHPVASALADDERSALRFLDWWRALELGLREASVPAPARLWGRRLRAVVNDLLRCAETEESAVACLRWVAELEEVPADEVLDAGAVLDWLTPRRENATSLRTALDGSVLFGRLEQVRGLPCRVLALLGLQDEAFPRAERRPAWSLTGLRPERWDPDTRRRDRQLFLDLVLTPSERLVLTAANRNRRTQHDGPVSACVEELLRAASAWAGTAGNETGRWRTRHPLQPFAPAYFEAERATPTDPALALSFDEIAADIAARMASDCGAEAGAFYQGDKVAGVEAEATEPRAVTLDQLIAFWKHPARGWLKALGVASDAEEPDEEALDDPPISLDGLQSYVVAEKVLSSSLGLEAGPEALRARLSADRALAPGALGRLRWAGVQAELRGLTTVLPERLREARTEAISVLVEVSGEAGGPGYCCRVTGEASVVPPGRGEETPRVLVYRPGKYNREGHARHRLAAWVPTLAAAAATGATTGGLVCGTEVDPGRSIKHTGCVSAEQARGLLVELVRGYWLGRQRPLAFAPETSVTLARVAADPDGGEAAALEAAGEVWSRTGEEAGEGEGLDDAARLAWRDRDPFTGAAAHEWLRWALRIAAPLDQWWAGDVGAGERGATLKPEGLA